MSSASGSNVVSLSDHRNEDARSLSTEKITSSKDVSEQDAMHDVAFAAEQYALDSVGSPEINSPEIIPPVKHFELVHYLEQLNFLASVEIADLDTISQSYSYKTRNQVLSSVNKILCQQFGRNRVWRDGLVFYTRHRNFEELIAGLLRVQFYAKQIVLGVESMQDQQVGGAHNEVREKQLGEEYGADENQVAHSASNCISIIWGVGRNREEASRERGRQRIQKNLLT